MHRQAHMYTEPTHKRNDKHTTNNILLTYHTYFFHTSTAKSVRKILFEENAACGGAGTSGQYTALQRFGISHWVTWMAVGMRKRWTNIKPAYSYDVCLGICLFFTRHNSLFLSLFLFLYLSISLRWQWLLSGRIVHHFIDTPVASITFSVFSVGVWIGSSRWFSSIVPTLVSPTNDICLFIWIIEMLFHMRFGDACMCLCVCCASSISFLNLQSAVYGKIWNFIFRHGASACLFHFVTLFFWRAIVTAFVLFLSHLSARSTL